LLAAEGETVAQTRPTILQIIPRLDTGGAELSAVEIAAAVVCAGGRALVLAEPGRLAPAVVAAGGEFIEFTAATKNPLRMLANARAIERLIRQQGVDLVHARSRAPAWSALVAARRARVPFVTTYHGAYGSPARKRFWRWHAAMASPPVYTADSSPALRHLVSASPDPSRRHPASTGAIAPSASPPAGALGVDHPRGSCRRPAHGLKARA
jgi:hypothetical protein